MSRDLRMGIEGERAFFESGGIFRKQRQQLSVFLVDYNLVQFSGKYHF